MQKEHKYNIERKNILRSFTLIFLLSFIFQIPKCDENIIDEKETDNIWTKVECGVSACLYDIDFVNEISR